MKKRIFFMLTGLIFSSAVEAMEWEGSYTLDNGLEITRTRRRIQINSGGLQLNSSTYSFGNQSRLNNSVACADGCLSLDLDSSHFRKEVLKLGNITNERLTNQ